MLRRSAANDNIFKLFSYIPFWLQQYITTHLKTNLIYGSVGFFEIQACEQTAYFQFCKITEFCLIFVRFIYIEPEQLYDINSFKGLFIFVC